MRKRFPHLLRIQHKNLGAMIAAKIANMRQGDNQYTATEKASRFDEVASIEATISQPQAAELLSVSRPSVQIPHLRYLFQHKAPGKLFRGLLVNTFS